MGRQFLAVMGSGGRIRITTCPELAEERVSPQGKRDTSLWPADAAVVAHCDRLSCSSLNKPHVQHVLVSLGGAGHLRGSGSSLVNPSTYSMSSAQLIAGTLTTYSSSLDSEVYTLFFAVCKLWLHVKPSSSLLLWCCQYWWA